MKKSERIEAFVATLGNESSATTTSFDPCYLGYFECFNDQLYYEAHDVLEHLWLKDGRDAPDYGFYKGLIQLAGGFVHLKLQAAQPCHPKHGRRLAPARRLFLLAEKNLAPYGLRHQGIDLGLPLMLARKYAELLAAKAVNPWNSKNAPSLPLPS